MKLEENIRQVTVAVVFQQRLRLTLRAVPEENEKKKAEEGEGEVGATTTTTRMAAVELHHLGHELLLCCWLVVGWLLRENGSQNGMAKYRCIHTPKITEGHRQTKNKDSSTSTFNSISVTTV